MAKAKRDKDKAKAVKKQLFLTCGRVDMYNLEIYPKKKLQLHHYPKFEHSHQTIESEGFLLSEEVHHELHNLEYTDPYQFYIENEYIYYNKQMILEKNRGKL